MFRALARPLLASWFVYAGIKTIMDPAARAKRSAPVIEPIMSDLGVTNVSTVDLVKVHGSASLAAASVFAVSRSPRLSATALTGLAAFTAAVGRPFWREEDPEVRANERDHFLKNLALLGAVMFASTVGHTPRHKARKKHKKDKAKAKSERARAA